MSYKSQKERLNELQSINQKLNSIDFFNNSRNKKIYISMSNEYLRDSKSSSRVFTIDSNKTELHIHLDINSNKKSGINMVKKY